MSGQQSGKGVKRPGIPSATASGLPQALPVATPIPSVVGANQAVPAGQASQSEQPGRAGQIGGVAKPNLLVALPLPPGATPLTGPAGKARAPTSAASPLPQAEQPEELSEWAIRFAPPWLISTAVHMMLMIILGLWWITAEAPADAVLLSTVEADDADLLGEQLDFHYPLWRDKLDHVDMSVLTPDHLPLVQDPLAAPLQLEERPDGTAMTSDIQANQIGLALSGREEGAKKSLLGRYGGTPETENAVLRGLEWLARNQRPDGSWSLSGPYVGGVPTDFDNPQAATAMALLAFQGHGNTHLKGRYKANVAKGWKWLLAQQDSAGCFFRQGGFNHHFYTQGLCTVAICELLGMSKDSKYAPPAELAVKYCLQSQSPEGGWRYRPNTESDVSVTGWIVMALQSARMAGLEVPEENLRRVEGFLDRVAVGNGSRYCYMPGRAPSLAMTAEALLCRQYLGWKRNDPRLVEGVKWLIENPIDYYKDRDAYYWYYATQVCHHMEGDYWKRWNHVMRKVLPEQQVKAGRESGSWDPAKPTQDHWGNHGGRLYVTCLSIYMLEVYYRHLPIYTKVYSSLFSP